MFYRFGNWLLNLDDVEVVMCENPFALKVRMKTGREYTLNCRSEAELEREKDAMVRQMRLYHPEPVSRYELDTVVSHEVQKVRNDVRTIKKLLLEVLNRER